MTRDPGRKAAGALSLNSSLLPPGPSQLPPLLWRSVSGQKESSRPCLMCLNGLVHQSGGKKSGPMLLQGVGRFCLDFLWI